MTTIAAIAVAPEDDRWADVASRAPQLAATVARYLDQIALSLRASSVVAAEMALRDLASPFSPGGRVDLGTRLHRLGATAEVLINGGRGQIRFGRSEIGYEAARRSNP